MSSADSSQPAGVFSEVQGRARVRRRAVSQHAVGAGLVLRPRQHHELLARRNLVARVGLAVGAERDQRIVSAQRHEHGAAALDGLVDAVVEELAEEREQRVVRRREADVRRHVRDEQRLVRGHAAGGNARDGRGTRVGIRRARMHARVVLRAHRELGRGDGCRVGRRLVDDQVRDQAGLRSRTRSPSSARTTSSGWCRCQGRRSPSGCLGGAEDGGRQARERLVRGRELVAAREQVVARSIDRAQAVAGEPVRDLVPSRGRPATGSSPGRRSDRD